ncbi:MAG: aminoglycoside phosphotransferase family protein [Candidatus Dormiibacterota bacterium]
MNSQTTEPATVKREQSLVSRLLNRTDADRIVYLDRGWDSRVYLVGDGEAVFKFPRSEAARRAYAREIAVLDLLQSISLPVQIPRVQWRDPENRYFGYRGTIGFELSDRLDLMTGAELTRAGSTLGYFLKALHSLNVDLPRTTIDQEVQEYQQKFRLSFPVLRHHFSATKLVVLEHFFLNELPAVLSGLGGDLCFSHGDLGPWNVVLSEDGRLGVIDFGDVGYYDRSKDFVAMKAPVMLEAAVNSYGDAPQLREKIAIRQKAFPIADLPYYIGKGDQEGIDRYLGEIESTFFAEP